ncbi:HEAT repeat domain-containing protein [Kitasatospora sp. NPDC051853]|uniref:HEAT repeat domain-containing protein n=1 Tax=Kitasatospora sp. NPDC051853 TaxID=3364058 RepID=UPI003794F913
MERRRFWFWGRRPSSEVRVEVGGAQAVGVGRDVVHSAIGEHATAVHNEYKVYVAEGAAAVPTDGEAEQALAAYLARVRASLRRLNLDVLGPGDAAGELPQIELRQVFIPQLSRPFEIRLPDDLRRLLTEAGELVDGPLPPGLDSTVAQQLADAQRAVPPRPVLEVLADGAVQRLVVLGDPGAGKSTLAKYLALALAGGLEQLPEELAPLEGYVPLIVELREYAQERWHERGFEDFLDHVHGQSRMVLQGPVLTRVLEHGRVVVVFDGLDEVFDPEARAETARRIAAFAGSRPQVRVVVTSREYGYRSHEFSAAGFSQVMLQNLERAQVEEFVRSWYAAAHRDEPDHARRLTRRLLDAVKEVRAVGELAANPLLLTILASIGLGRTIPRERRKVYEHAIEVLIGRWDRDAKFLKLPGPVDTEAARAVEWLTTARRFRLLERIARRMQDSTDRQSGTYIRHDELIEIVTGYLTDHNIGATAADIAAHHVVDHLRTRNFILAHFGGGIYGFVHRTFLEYLAASDILRRRSEEDWERQELLDHLGRHMADPAWHEVILLTVGGLRQRDAAAFLQHLLRHAKGRARREAAIQLGVRALAERDDFDTAPPVGAPGRHLSLTVQGNAVVDAMVMALFEDRCTSTPETGAALRSASCFWQGRTRYLRWYYALAGTGSDAAAAEVAVLMARGMDELRVQARIPWAPELREAAIEAIGVHWSGHDEAFSELLEAAGRECPGDRRAALYALGRSWPDREEAFAAVLAAVADAHPVVHRAALDTLVLQWPARTEVFEAVLGAVMDRNAPARREAIRAVGRWAGREDIVPALMAAASDESVEIRIRALMTLGFHYSDRPEVRRLVRAVVLGEVPEVRQDVLGLLDRFWPDAEEALDLLLSAAEDDFPAVRSSAVYSLASAWGDRQAALNTVVRVCAGSKEGSAELALYGLGREWRDRPEALEAVLAVAATGNPSARRTAFRVLGRSWSDRQESFDTVLAATAGRDLEDRCTAVFLLAECWGDREAAYSPVLAAVEAGDSTERIEAVYALARTWAAREAVMPALLAATTDGHHEIRGWALRVCALNWSERDEVTTALLAATTDGHHEVRASGLRLLGVARPEAAPTRDLMLAGADDEHPEVRAVALGVLTALSPEESLPLLLERARTDESAGVRVTVVRLTASVLPHAPQTRALLTELAEDADPEVADAAREALPLLDLPRPSLLP